MESTVSLLVEALYVYRLTLMLMRINLSTDIVYLTPYSVWNSVCDLKRIAYTTLGKKKVMAGWLAGK